MFDDNEFDEFKPKDKVVKTSLSSFDDIEEDVLIDMPNEDYHRRRDYISASMLKDLIHNPYLFWHPLERENKIAFDIGNAIHCLILEPHKFDTDFAVAPKVNKRTVKGRAELAKFIEDNKGKIVLTFDDAENCKALAKSTLAIPEVQALLMDCDFEQSMFTRIDIDIDGAIESIKAKVRYDGANKKKSMIIDVKSCEDASPRGFKKEIAKWLYHVQDAWYCNVLGYKNFIFLAVEKKPPYMCAFYQLAVVDRELGWELCLKALSRSLKPMDVNDKLYKARDGSFIQTITLPAYSHFDNEDM